MAQQLIDLAGQSVDSIRTAFSKINDNFTEVFDRCGPTGVGVYSGTLNEAPQLINLGVGPAMTGGDTIRQGFLKVVANFNTVFAQVSGTYLTINMGAGPDTQTGDTLAVALGKVNDNFTELYTVLGLTTATPEVEDPEFLSYTPTVYNFDRGLLVTSANTTTDLSFVDPYPSGLELIDLGTGPDTYTGDSLYVAFTKVNHNFTELYDVFGPNGGTNLQGNTITANYFVTTGNVRAGNVIAYGNIETIGNIIGAAFLYPNGVNLVDQISSNIDLTAINSNIIPAINGVLTLGNATNQFSSLFLSSSLILAGANVTTDGTQILINGTPASSSYSNVNVANYLPTYAGNLNSVNHITANSVSVNNNLTVAGHTTLNSLSVNNASEINGDLTVKGNLSVDGNITYFNIENLTIEDPIITLNTGANGGPLTTNVNFDSGVQSYYYDGVNRAAFFGRKDSSGYFEYYSNVVTEVGNIVSGELGTIRTGNLILTNTATISGNVNATNVEITTDLTVQGKVSVFGNLVAAIVSAAGGFLDTLVLRAGLQDTPIGNAIPSTGNFTTLSANTSTTTQILTVNANASISGTTTTDNLVVSNISNLGNVGNVVITGGAADQYLSTDGAGNLSWRSFANSSIVVDTFVGNGVQNTFALSVTPVSSNYVLVNVNGVFQLHDSYSISGNLLILNTPPPININVEAITFTLASGGVVAALGSKAIAINMLLS